MRRIVALMVLVVSASGCWLQAGFDATKAGDNTGERVITAANVSGLRVAWSANPSGGSAFGEPLVRGASVFSRSTSTMTALDAGTGAQQWSAAGPSVAAIVGEKLVVASGTYGTPTPCVARMLAVGTGAQLSFDTFPQRNDFPVGVDGTFVRCQVTDVLWAHGKVLISWSLYASDLGLPGCGSGMATTLRAKGVWVDNLDGSDGWAGLDETVARDCENLGFDFPIYYNAVSASGDSYLVAGATVVSAYPVAGCPAGTT